MMQLLVMCLLGAHAASPQPAAVDRGGKQQKSLDWCAGVLQEDHSMWTESLLFHTLPKPVSDFLEYRWLPLMGECRINAVVQCSCADTGMRIWKQ